MTTRSYYVPSNQIGRHVMNRIVEDVSCSISEIKMNRAAEVMRFTITTNDRDIKQVERTLKYFGMLED